jgi:hypothetical protein
MQKNTDDYKNVEEGRASGSVRGGPTGGGFILFLQEQKKDIIIIITRPRFRNEAQKKLI